MGTGLEAGERMPPEKTEDTGSDKAPMQGNGAQGGPGILMGCSERCELHPEGCGSSWRVLHE